MGRAGVEPAILHQELGPKPSAYANSATCPFIFCPDGYVECQSIQTSYPLILDDFLCRRKFIDFILYHNLSFGVNQTFISVTTVIL